MAQMTRMGEAVQSFRANFRSGQDAGMKDTRWVGLENEYPLVSSDGTMVKPIVVTHLWQKLQQQGWELMHDSVLSTVVAARRQQPVLQSQKAHAYDLITTDMGYATLEIDLAPTRTLYEADTHLRGIMQVLTVILEEEGASLL